VKLSFKGNCKKTHAVQIPTIRVVEVMMLAVALMIHAAVAMIPAV
jgi:hypothetical protein